MFPNVDRTVLERDLRQTRSMERTVENALSGRLPTRPIAPTPTTQDMKQPSTTETSQVKPGAADAIKVDPKLIERVWLDDPEQRHLSYHHRKMHMIQLARQYVQ